LDGVRGVWRSRYERSRGPVCIVLLLGTLGYPGGVRDIIGGGLVHRLACRLERRQITELSNASAPPRLTELPPPRVRKNVHLLTVLWFLVGANVGCLGVCLFSAVVWGWLEDGLQPVAGSDVTWCHASLRVEPVYDAASSLRRWDAPPVIHM